MGGEHGMCAVIERVHGYYCWACAPGGGGGGGSWEPVYLIVATVSLKQEAPVVVFWVVLPTPITTVTRLPQLLAAPSTRRKTHLTKHVR